MTGAFNIPTLKLHIKIVYFLCCVHRMSNIVAEHHLFHVLSPLCLSNCSYLSTLHSFFLIVEQFALFSNISAGTFKHSRQSYHCVRKLATFHSLMYASISSTLFNAPLILCTLTVPSEKKNIVMGIIQ